MKIKTLTNLRGVIITIDGKKKIDEKGEIDVTTNTARQMVDGVNWQLGKGEVFPKQKKIEVVEEDFDENEEGLEDEDFEGDVDGDGDEDTADQDLATLLKSVPSMKKQEAISAAEELGIDVDEYDGKLSKLKAKIIKVLKGKETAEE